LAISATCQKKLGVDIDKNFEPNYEISPDKKDVVSALKKAAKDRTVWLASDPDREGEAIAWHLAHALGLDPAKPTALFFTKSINQPSKRP
jgi:DNA topoisomerase-1